VRSRVSEARGEKGDAGQALVMALIVVFIVSMLPAIVISSLIQQISDGSRSVNYEAALAGAQAGVQEYRNLLDQYTGYWQYSGAEGKTIPATEGGPNPAMYGWETVPNVTPLEGFTYTPQTTDLTVTKSASTPFGGDVLLVVTGEAGSGSTKAYRRIDASFSLSGVLTDVYYSNFEQPGAGDFDQWENTYASGCSQSCTFIKNSDEYDEATATTPPAGFTGYPVESYAAALCQYDASSPNTFIDWYSQNVSPLLPLDGYPGTKPYSPTNPYYGPWYGNWKDPLNSAYQFGEAPTSGRASGDQSACNENYYISPNTFNGPVYSADELTTCGTPSFTGSPSLQTAISSSFPFPGGWPGTRPAVGGVSYPYGYEEDPWGECGTRGATADSPTFTGANGVGTGSVAFGVQQSLPPVEDSLAPDIEQNKFPGCVYTGPTMIRFYWNASTASETMDVWSPLTKDTYASGGAACGAIDATANGPGDLCGGTVCTTNAGGVATNTQVCAVAQAGVCAVGQVASTGNFAQVSLAKPEVIWVQALPGATTDPNFWSTVPTAESDSTAAGCIDPWISPGSSIGPTTCNEADLIIGGAVGGQVTLGSANNIVLSRSLVYDCAVNAGGSYQTNIANCSSSITVVGLIADHSIWLSRPLGVSNCTDDNDMPLSSVTWDNIIPTYCDIENPIIDGATAALSGFFEAQNWKEGGNNGNIYFNGSDAVNNAGQYGTFSGSSIVTGYNLKLQYDPRLLVDPPPQYVQATDSVWQVAGWVTCGNTSPNPDSDPATGSSFTGYSDWSTCASPPGSYAP